jgi:hypothetical protein
LQDSSGDASVDFEDMKGKREGNEEMKLSHNAGREKLKLTSGDCSVEASDAMERLQDFKTTRAPSSFTRTSLDLVARLLLCLAIKSELMDIASSSSICSWVFAPRNFGGAIMS